MDATIPDKPSEIKVYCPQCLQKEVPWDSDFMKCGYCGFVLLDPTNGIYWPREDKEKE